MSVDRNALVFRASLAEALERWKDMVDCVQSVANLGTELTLEERNLLAISFKHYVGDMRTSWRVLCSVEEKADSYQRKKDLTTEYRVRIENKIKETCNTVLELVDKQLQNSSDVESKVFYLKMRGDYNRYIMEVSKDDVHSTGFHNAKKAYEDAMELAKEKLSAAHPIRLGVVLNFSVFQYELLNNFEKACEMSEEGYNLAMSDLTGVSEDSKKDSLVIMQLLKNNVSIWTAEVDELSQKKVGFRE